MTATASSTHISALSVRLNVSGGTFYFSYGSNMWLDQMAHRCPNSKYLGIANVPGYRWIINARGSANIVQVSNTHTANPSESQQPSLSDPVWGLVYYLAPSDEAYLDTREHVPDHFTKEMLPTQFWPSKYICEAPFSSATEDKIDVAKAPETVDMLVYVNRLRTTEDLPRDEYVLRMNKGISDALKVGVSEEYVDKVVRKFIPK